MVRNERTKSLDTFAFCRKASNFQYEELVPSLLTYVNIFLFKKYFEKFWVVENSFTIATKLNKINTKEKPKKSISTFDFTSLHTTMPHNLLSQSRDGVSKKSIY